MGILNFLFGKKESTPEDNRDIAEHLEFLHSLRAPAVAILRSDGQAFSKIGGLPDMPDEMNWPEWKGNPLSFLCQMDLSEIRKKCAPPELPSSGLLYFFYDQEQRTWGFDPEDKGSWQVLYIHSTAQGCRKRERPDGLKEDCIYQEKFVTFSALQTYPDVQDKRVSALKLTDGQADQYIELCSSVFQGKPSHHLFGYPAPVQGNDMDLECQLVTSGLYCGDPSGYNDPRAKELEAGRTDWILLLQLDTDDDTGMMWGDCGMLYFWIRRNDLREARFENCWMILQCS